MPERPTISLREVDCLVLGGGITGAGVARDAAMRGLRTMLIDAADFASGTSHVTSKLVHGGLRYLEQFRFRLVVEGSIERDRLLRRMAPNLVTPIRFLIPFERRSLLRWLMVVTGLQLYGLIERIRWGRRTSAYGADRLRRDFPLLKPHPFGVTYWDAQTNDARLVLSTIRSASAASAEVYNYTTLRDANFADQRWHLTLESPDRGIWHVRARCVVNATGPWSPETAKQLGAPVPELLWLKGTHILLSRPASFGDDAVIIRSTRDRRSLWVIPWHNRLIVGATESIYDGDLRAIHPTPDEVDDLFDSTEQAFPNAGLTRNAISGAYSGVRPILLQPGVTENHLSREYKIERDDERALVTVSGGKLTTFRRMAERAVNVVQGIVASAPPSPELRLRLRSQMLWPGIARATARRLHLQLSPRARQLRVEQSTLVHLVRHYGADASLVLDDIAANADHGRPLFANLPYSLAELAYVTRAEAVYHLLDLIRRRTPIYFLANGGGSLRFPEIAAHVAPILGWSAKRQAEEINLARDTLRADHAAFSSSENKLAGLVHRRPA